MQLIKSIGIRYLRSIHRLRLEAGDLTVLSGANDVGKSNILKALNLFFNNEVDWLEDLDFYRDFSLRRLNEVRRESVKGKQFIRIDIEFLRPPSYAGSLPPTFSVARIWLRDSDVPDERDDLERRERDGRLPSTLTTARRMLPRFLNRVRFEYVPAIRGPDYFEYVLNHLQETILATQMEPEDAMLTAVGELNESLRERAGTLRSDFEQATGIEADISLPVEPSALFQAFSVSTRWRDRITSEQDDPQRVSLSLRGDGIQARYVPSLLQYIVDNSSLFHIWGFEEPENSVEYNLAIALANEFERLYSKDAQIFVTSHSPAFMSLRGQRTASYRVYKSENATQVTQLHPATDEDAFAQLAEDIGLLRLQEENHQHYLQQREEFLRVQERVEHLQAELAQSAQPVVYVEGKTDAAILGTAWEKLYVGQMMPFQIKSCDPLPKNADGGSGGADTLSKLLSTVRADSAHIAVGIFDRDKEGIDRYNGLPGYFHEIAWLGTKVSRTNRAAAFLLPVPRGRKAYVTCLNLKIEFYFDEDALARKTEEGFGLVFRQPQIESRLKCHGGPVMATTDSDLPESRQIVEGKTVFAETIVPTLDPSKFEDFKLVFDRIRAVLQHIQGQKTTESGRRQAGPPPDGLTTADSDPTGRKPTDFDLLGQQYRVSSWRAMLRRVCQILSGAHGDDFAGPITQIRGRSRPYISYDASDLRQPEQISGTRLWLETNLSAKSVLDLIEKMLQALGHDRQDFEAHWG